MRDVADSREQRWVHHRGAGSQQQQTHGRFALPLAQAGQGSLAPRTNALPARVGNVVYQGDTFLVQAILEDGTRVSARAIAGAAALAHAPALGEPMELHFDAGEAVLLPGEGPR
jgi:hypothetical protein